MLSNEAGAAMVSLSSGSSEALSARRKLRALLRRDMFSPASPTAGQHVFISEVTLMCTRLSSPLNNSLFACHISQAGKCAEASVWYVKCASQGLHYRSERSLDSYLTRVKPMHCRIWGRSLLASMGSSRVTLWSFMSCTRACSERKAAKPTCPAAAAMSPGARGGCASVPCDRGAACAPRTSRSTTLASQA